MLLEGHEGELFTVDFHPEGQYLASSGFDRRICEFHIFVPSMDVFNCFTVVLWNVYGECENLSVLSGHQGAVMELHFTPDGYQIFTCSTDNTLGLWDITTGQRIKKLKGHTTFVNTVQGARRGPQILASGSDDTTVKMWDTRKRNCIASFNNNYQVICSI